MTVCREDTLAKVPFIPMYKHTKYLIIISFILSCLNFFTSSFYNQELYPFFHWKLYSQPLGNDYTYTDYRLYGINNSRDTIRIQNANSVLFSKDDRYYFLSREVTNIKTKSIVSQKLQQRLGDFGDAITKNAYDDYLLVEESFNPLNLIIDPNAYTKSIIYEVHQ